MFSLCVALFSQASKAACAVAVDVPAVMFSPMVVLV